MASERIESLIARLEKGHLKTSEFFSSLTPEQWTMVVYEDPHRWDFRCLLAHFVSSEERLLELVQHVASGGEDLPADFDFNQFNAEEQVRLEDEASEELMKRLDEFRKRTLSWVHTLEEEKLDLVGRHPALGPVTLETMINAIYGHQLIHMKEVRGKIE